MSTIEYLRAQLAVMEERAPGNTKAIKEMERILATGDETKIKFASQCFDEAHNVGILHLMDPRHLTVEGHKSLQNDFERTNELAGYIRLMKEATPRPVEAIKVAEAVLKSANDAAIKYTTQKLGEAHNMGTLNRVDPRHLTPEGNAALKAEFEG